MELPFDGAITRYFEQDAPRDVRDAIRKAEPGNIINPDYPHDSRLSRKIYHRDLQRMQIELVKLQAWVKSSGARVAVVFEGRDAAGKGGTINRFREYLNPRGARVVALTKPSETERTEWYFQRYVDHLPAGGEIVFFDRSWYNRGVVEKVFGFCTEDERERFFRQVLPFEQALTDDGIHLFKFWLNVGRAEQLHRFLAREQNPLKQWKLSPIDIQGLSVWSEYSRAIAETLRRSHSDFAPWTVIRADDKRRARIEAIRHVLLALDFKRKSPGSIGTPDPKVIGGPDLWDD